ncbi:MAG: methionyl-tRNA formyltransferase [Planctomycetota bacterium]
MNIVFFGTEDFPVATLRALVEAGMPPSLVVTKPDAPRGRGRKIYPQKVRLVAEELGLPCEQPADCLDPAFLDRLREAAPDVVLVVSYGRILSPEFLAIPGRYSLNLHASLLPRWRGAAPIHWAIWAGDAETGVTVQRIVPKLDAGPVLLTKATPIDPHENSGQLFGRLSELGAEASVEALRLVEAGRDEFVEQDHAQATRAPKLEKEQGYLDWTTSAAEIDRTVRAFTPKPGARTRYGPKKLILLEGRTEEDSFGLGVPGGILTSGEEGIRVCTGKGIYRILRLKPENGRNMTAGEFARGHYIPPDARMG